MVGDLYRQPSARPARRHGVRGRAALRRRACAVPADQRERPARLPGAVRQQGRPVFLQHADAAAGTGGRRSFRLGAYAELSPYVYSDGAQTLFLRAEEVWARSTRGSGGGLVSRPRWSTGCGRAGRRVDQARRRVSQLRHGVAEGRHALLLRRDGAIAAYLQPDLPDPDPVAADFLLRSQETRQITADDIRKLIRGGAGGAAVRDRAGGQDALPQDLLDFLG